ncbi:MAG: hypothetical protein HY815_25510 [Candidatus Riflebacteria bacterium]|nr:hypothetical protein [Candidatus Riflebacteria bacterium]
MSNPRSVEGSGLLAAVLLLGGLLTATLIHVASTARQSTAWASKNRGLRQSWMAADLAAQGIVAAWAANGRAPSYADLARPGSPLAASVPPRTALAIRELFGLVILDVSASAAGSRPSPSSPGWWTEGLTAIVVTTRPAPGVPGPRSRVRFHWAWKAPVLGVDPTPRFAAAPATWEELD